MKERRELLEEVHDAVSRHMDNGERHGYEIAGFYVVTMFHGDDGVGGMTCARMGSSGALPSFVKRVGDGDAALDAVIAQAVDMLAAVGRNRVTIHVPPPDERH